MKIIIASDIHGSACYCRKLVQTVQEQNADRLLLLGDVLYHGPRNPLPEEYAPMRVVEMLDSVKEKITCVRGNCDSEVDQMVLPFPCMSDYAVVSVDGLQLVLSHGHRAVPPLGENCVYLTGHTHVPLNVVENGVLHLNPGSTSLPKEGSGNGYILYENGTFRFMTFDGDCYDTATVKL